MSRLTAEILRPRLKVKRSKSSFGGANVCVCFVCGGRGGVNLNFVFLCVVFGLFHMFSPFHPFSVLFCDLTCGAGNQEDPTPFHEKPLISVNF